MKLILLIAAATAHITQGEWCTECKNIVEAFDSLDATTIADEICPLIESNGICEDIAPYMIEWVQTHCDSETICEDLCDDEDVGKMFIIEPRVKTNSSDDGWCDECKNIVETFDNLDATIIANDICPFLQYNGLCEDIAPYVIDWIQQNVTPDTICSELCSTGEDYNTYGDYNEPIEAPLHVAKELHHHPFDIPRSKDPEPDHAPKEIHHHPFDIPHPTKPEAPHVAKELHHHPFDIPHPKPSSSDDDDSYIGFHEVHHDIN